MKYGLLGYPLGHSMSPKIHALLRIPDYQLFSTPSEQLDSFLRAGDYQGLNVTIPYKRAVIPYCDFLSEQARSIGSVNTLTRDAEGRLHGHNTDYAGLLFLAQQTGISFSGKQVLILGSGGASLTAQAVAKDQAAADIHIVSRSGPIDYQNVYQLKNTEIIINATPVGMYPNIEDCPLDLSRFTQLQGIIDMIYNPLRTSLLLDAEDLGVPTANGLLMLAHQAKVAEELFLGEPIPDSYSRRAARQLKQDMTNIVFIGMPGCGKSTVAQEVAERTGKTLVDTDKLIEKESGLSIPQIFQNQGETAFRRLETAILRRVAAKGGQVISCGGGIILREENRRLLRQNGRIYLLKSELKQLACSGRPLSSSPEAIEQIAQERDPLYHSLADRVIWNDMCSNAAARQAEEDFYAYFAN